MPHTYFYFSNKYIANKSLFNEIDNGNYRKKILNR